MIHEVTWSNELHWTGDVAAIELRSPFDRTHDDIDAVKVDRTPELVRTLALDTTNVHRLRLHSVNR
jgi:hypothetical protein